MNPGEGPFGQNDKQDASVADFQEQLREKDDAICKYDDVRLQGTVNDRQRDPKLKKEEPQYPTEMRRLVYEVIVNYLPTKKHSNFNFSVCRVHWCYC